MHILYDIIISSTDITRSVFLINTLDLLARIPYNHSNFIFSHDEEKALYLCFSESRRVVRVGKQVYGFRLGVIDEESNGFARYSVTELAGRQHGWQRGSVLVPFEG